MNDLERMRAGEWLYAITPEIGSALRYAEELCFQLNGLAPGRREERDAVVRRLFGRVGRNCILHSPFHCDFGTNIRAGKNLICNYNVTILDEGEVTIGDNVFIGPNCSIYTIIHALNPQQRNGGIMRSAPVTIGSDVWLGGNVVVLPGVTIGDGSVIGAGSVVVKDIPSGVLAVGNPCKVVRPITAADDVEENEILR